MKTSHFPKITGCAILVVLLSGLGGCGGKLLKNTENAVNNLFKEDGYEKLLERQRAAAPPELEPKKLPDMTAAEHEMLGDSYMQQGKPEMAFLQYSKALQKKPENMNAVYKRGMVYLSRGMLEAALKDFRAVLEKEPTHALALQGMGQAYLKMKNDQEAEKYFRQAIQSNPKLWMPHNFLGLIYDDRQQYSAAAEEYRAALAIKPDEATVCNNLGVSYSLAGEYEKAVEAFSQGLRIKPKDAKLGNNLGLVLLKLGRHREAIEAFRVSGDEAQAYNNLGVIYLEQGDYEKAARAFERAIALRSEYYPQAQENLKKAEIGYSSSIGPSPPRGWKPEPARDTSVVAPASNVLGTEVRETTLPKDAGTPGDAHAAE